MAATEQNFPPKDRRMLVLFLFGSFLLAGDLSASFQSFVGNHSTGGMQAGSLVPIQSAAKGAGQRSERVKRLHPRLAFFLGKPMAINRASLEDLVLLPGIGKHRAARILAYQHLHGPIHTLAELEKVPGISRKFGRKISSMISFDSAGDTQSIHAD